MFRFLGSFLIISSLLVVNNLFAETKSANKTTTKECVCPTTKTINNEKYNCRKSKDGTKCLCTIIEPSAKDIKNKAPANKNTKQAPAKTKNKQNTPANKTKTNVAIAPKHAQQHKKSPKKNVSNIKKEAPINKPTIAKEALNPLIIVSSYKEDPTFVASITGLLYSKNKNIDIINVSSTTDSENIVIQAYKLLKTASFWGKDAVFISTSDSKELDPTIIVIKSKNNQFFITQNSGVITFIKNTIGISDVRLAQRVNFKSEMLSGRDVEYVIASRLLGNPSHFENIGETISINKLNTFNYTPIYSGNNNITSFFITEDIDKGNLFTFIPSQEFEKFSPKDNDVFKIILSTGNTNLIEEEAIYKNSSTYIGGTEITILDYKSSIGTFIAVKNIQNQALKDFTNTSTNNKISFSLLKKGKPIDISKIENIDSNKSLDEEKSALVPYSSPRSSNIELKINNNDLQQNPADANIKNLYTPKRGADIAPVDENNDEENYEDEEDLLTQDNKNNQSQKIIIKEEKIEILPNNNLQKTNSEIVAKKETSVIEAEVEPKQSASTEKKATTFDDTNLPKETANPVAISNSMIDEEFDDY